MINKLLRWLSSPRMRDNRYEHEDDAWKELEGLGYTMQRQKGITDKRGLSSYRMLKNGKPASKWMHNLTEQESRTARRVWADGELAWLKRKK